MFDSNEQHRVLFQVEIKFKLVNIFGKNLLTTTAGKRKCTPLSFFAPVWRTKTDNSISNLMALSEVFIVSLVSTRSAKWTDTWKVSYSCFLQVLHRLATVAQHKIQCKRDSLTSSARDLTKCGWIRYEVTCRVAWVCYWSELTDEMTGLLSTRCQIISS